MQFHSMYAPLVPKAQPLSGNLSLFAIKWERHAGSGLPAPLDLIDVVALAGDRLLAIPFIRYSDERVIFPEAAQSYGEPLLNAIEHSVREWMKAKAGGAEPPVIDVFLRDPLLTPLIEDMEPGNAIVPGLVLHSQLFAATEIYRYVAPYCANRRILDLNPGSGYPASPVRARAASYTAVAANDRDEALFHRMCDEAALKSSAAPADVLLALGLQPSAVTSAARVALNAVADGGRAFLSARGTGAAEALAEFGTPVRLFPLGGEATGGFDEYYVAIEPSPKSDVISKPATAPVIRLADRPLSILFVLRDTAERMFGGDVVQVRETADALRGRGHRVDITTQAQPPTDGYDIVQLSNLTAGSITLQQAIAVESFPGPVTMMPIFTDHADETAWGIHAAPVPFRFAQDVGELEEWLMRLSNREYSVNEILPPPARSDLYSGATQQQREMLARTDYLVANAYSEVHRIYRFLTAGIPFTIVPSCANPRIYGPHTAGAFRQRYDLGDFVLVTGRFEARKNQLLLFEAARRRPERTFVCIGRNYEADYGQLVRRYCPRNVMILPHMPESELAGAYAAARVVALPAWDEVVSLTCLNASISAASLVLTRNSYEHEYALDDAEYCDPGDYRSILDAIDRAWASHDERADRRQRLADRVRAQFTWDRAAELTEAAYYRLLAHNPRGAQRLRRFSTVLS